jgi:hypothetical protein
LIRHVPSALALVALAAAPAAADDEYLGMTDVGDLDPLRPRLSQQIADGVTELGDEIDAHLGALSAGVVSLRFDGRSREIHLGFDLQGDNVAFKFRSDVVVRGGVARVDARIDLRLVGRHVHVELPDFEVVPRSYDGDRYVEVRLPLLTGRF